MDRIPEKIDSTFRFVLLAARRAEQLMRGARPRVDAGSPKPTRIALREVSDELINWDYGPPPAPPEAVEATAGEEESAGG
ncbi:MAG TPA: DNA-directed RNA polymerase subunit omega [Thermoanaerobaculia bacterium]|jgi:DNA-directed RNA polymerase subunit omega